MKGSPDPELQTIKQQQLALLEQQSEHGTIDLYYGDESGVSELGYVPYGWQFKDEKVHIKAAHGQQLNCFGLMTRNNDLIFKTTTKSINTNFIVEFLDDLSLAIKKHTVIVLDNARIHTAHKIKERLSYWQHRGLFIFYLPPYCPHFNIIERLWKELKARWIKPQDYSSKDQLFYATQQCLNQVGKQLKIKFQKYS